MSARRVCNGTRPSRYHSVRAISLPPNRPAHDTLMPLAPRRSADTTAFFIARRKAIRFSNCSAIFSATSCASTSGFLISRMLMTTWRLVKASISALSLSTSAPLRPMMIPGLEVCRLIRSWFPERSISIRAIPAWYSLAFTILRTLRSSCSSAAYSLPANQREFHDLMYPNRNPTGWTLCPTVCRSLRPAGRRRRAPRGPRPGRDHHGNVAHAFVDRVRAPLRRRLDPFERRSLVDHRSTDHQVVHVADLTVFRVGDGRPQHLFHHPRRASRRKLEHRESLPRAFTADQIDHAPRFAGRDPREFQHRFCFRHVSDVPSCGDTPPTWW